MLWKKISESFLYALFLLISSSFMPVSTNNYHNDPKTIFLIAMAETDNIKQAIETVKKKVADDLRVTLFNINSEEKDGKIILSGKVLEKSQKTELINSLKRFGNIEDKVEVFPFSDVGELSYGIVNLPVLNIRGNPKHSAELVSQGLMGMGLKILGKEGEWLFVSLDDDSYIGWVKQSDVLKINNKDYNSFKNNDKVMLTDLIVNLLNSPDKNDKSQIKLYMTTRLKLVKESVNFYQIKLPGGNKHYSNKDFFIPKESAKLIGNKMIPDSNISKNIVNKAKLFMSVPYLWGGASPLMTDCSGFTQSLYKVNGYVIPRDADQQQNFSTPVKSRNDLKPGDLVFFPGHVGMYIGDKKFIHSSVGYGGVAITSFDEKDPLFYDWYIKNYKGAGRIIR